MKNTNIKLEKIFFSYEPHYEIEVCLLFGLLLPYLKNEWILDEYSGSFPDAIFWVDGKEVRVEFEVFSADFLAHKHDEDKCDVIVCWKDNWPGCKLRVYELSKEIYKIGLNKIIKNERTKYNQILDMTIEKYYAHLENYNDSNIVDAVRKFINKMQKDEDLILIFKKGSKVRLNLNICIKNFKPHNTFVGLESRKSGFVAWPWFKLLENHPAETEIRELFKVKKGDYKDIKPNDVNELKELINKIEKAIKIVIKYVRVGQ